MEEDGLDVGVDESDEELRGNKGEGGGKGC